MFCANWYEPQAMNGTHIFKFECINCRGCEKFYLNAKLCSYDALQRAAVKK